MGFVMSNAAYTEKYKQYLNFFIPLFTFHYFKGKEEIPLSDGYILIINEYAGEIDGLNLCGCECLLKFNRKIIANWRSVDNSSDFYKIIKHSNGKKYLIFRQDLYGYSVLDIKLGTIMQFFPEKSLNGSETFIWTGVEYNEITNVLAVSGCYWACPYSLHLFTFDNPMSENQKFVDLMEYFHGGYDDVSFENWSNGDLLVIRYIIDAKANEKVIITQSEYLTWFRENAQE